MTVTEIYDTILSGQKVFWGHEGYQVLITQAHKGCEYQANHHSNVNGLLLEIRYLANWFGGLIDEEELSDVYVL